MHRLLLAHLCSDARPSLQVAAKDVADIPPPITGDGPDSVPGQQALTQDLKAGPLQGDEASGRGVQVK